MTFFEIDEKLCRTCLGCLTACPTEAIHFKAGRVAIDHDRCVACGTCFRVCPHGAIGRRNQLQKVKDFIAARRKVILAVDPACLAFLPKDLTMEQLAAAAQDLGVWDVADASEAACAVASEYARILQEKKMDNVILSYCPVTQNLIEQHYPQLLPYVAPVASPMIACGRMLKRDFTSAAVVYVSTCAGRMDEAEDVRHSTEVNAVISIGELMEWFRQEGIDPLTYEEEPLLTDGGGLGEKSAFSGGMMECISHYTRDHGYEPIVVDGIPACLELLEELSQGSIHGCVIEMSACLGGCVGGVDNVVGEGPRGRFAAELQIREYVRNREKNYYFNTRGIAMANPAINRSAGAVKFSEEDISEMMYHVGVGNERQQRNCGICGYDTCRERAIAILEHRETHSICPRVVKAARKDMDYALYQNLPLAGLLVDDTLLITSFNREAAELFGLKREQEKYIFEFMDPGDFQYVLDTGLSIKNRRFDIPELYLRVEVNLVALKEQDMVLALFRDITEEEEKEARELEEKLRSVEMAQKVIDKQMTVAQEIAYLLGETTAETKVTLNQLKQRILGEEGDE